MFDVRKNPKSLVPRNSSQPCFPAGVPPLKAAGWRSSSDAHRGLLSEMALNGPCGVLSDSRPEVFKFKLCKHWVFVQVKLSCGPPICDLWSQVCFFPPNYIANSLSRGWFLILPGSQTLLKGWLKLWLLFPENCTFADASTGLSVCPGMGR